MNFDPRRDELLWSVWFPAPPWKVSGRERGTTLPRRIRVLHNAGCNTWSLGHIPSTTSRSNSDDSPCLLLWTKIKQRVVVVTSGQGACIWLIPATIAYHPDTPNITCIASSTHLLSFNPYLAFVVSCRCTIAWHGGCQSWSFESCEYTRVTRTHGGRSWDDLPRHLFPNHKNHADLGRSVRRDEPASRRPCRLVVSGWGGSRSWTIISSCPLTL